MAGGYATRLWPITRSISKPLLPLGSKRIIDFIVDQLIELSVVDSIYVTTNAFYEDQFRQWIDERGCDIELIVEGTRREEEKLGTIRAMYEAFKIIGDDEYFVIGGDNVMSLNFKDFFKFYEDKRAPVLAVYELEDIRDVSRFGEVTIDANHKITLLREKPNDPKSKLVSTACYIFPKGTLSLLEEYVKSGKKLDSPGYFIEWLHQKTNVFAFPFTGYWFDIGTPKGYIEAFTAINKGVVREESSEVSNNSIVSGSVYLGQRTSIKGSKIENSLIWHNSRIEDCVIKNSIILSNIELKNTKLEWCIIGDYAKIQDIEIKNSVIGEYSKISITNIS